jgi:hypothetical protein
MVRNIWKLLQTEFQKNQELQAGPVLNFDIERAQESLGIKFDENYREFLLKYGGAKIGSTLVHGLRKQKDMHEQLSTVVALTHFYRAQQWPNINNLYIISSDVSGNPIGIDRQGKVWLSNRESEFELVKLANSFEDFLYKLHTNTLYE